MAFANHIRICGIVEDDYNNNDWILSNMEKFDPKCMVLGSLSYTDMEKIKHPNRRFFYPPLYEPISREQTMATREMNRFLNNEIDINLHYFHDEFEDDSIFRAEHSLKRKIATPELSLAKVFDRKRARQLFFGDPNPMFVIEDIALSYSLEELQAIFFEVLERYRIRMENKEMVPQTEMTDYLFNYRQSVLTHFPHLFSKRMMYTAAITRKLLKIYSRVGLAIDNAHVRKTRKYIEDPNLPEFDKIFHQKEFFDKIDTILAR